MKERKFWNWAFSSVQSCRTLCDPLNRSMPGLPVHHQLPEFTQTHVHRVMPSSHLILCHPLFLLPLIPPSIRVFSNESTLHMRIIMTKIKILIDEFTTELDTAQEKKIGWLEDRSVENRLKNQGGKKIEHTKIMSAVYWFHFSVLLGKPWLYHVACIESNRFI